MDGVGNAESTANSQLNPRGVGTPRFQEEQADQKIGKAGVVDSAFHQAHYGQSNTKGK